jgi:hypothetical protein
LVHRFEIVAQVYILLPGSIVIKDIATAKLLLQLNPMSIDLQSYILPQAFPGYEWPGTMRRRQISTGTLQKSAEKSRLAEKYF